MYDTFSTLGDIMPPNDGEIVWDQPEEAAPPPRKGAKRRYAWGDPELPIDEKGRLLTPVTCRGCWADLQGQKIKGKCPDCGEVVARSARGNRLRYADPAWVDTIRSGVSTLLIGVLCYFMLLLLAVAVQVGLNADAMFGQDNAREFGRPKPPTMEQLVEQAAGPPAFAAVTLVIALVGSAVMMVGVWKLTAPEPGDSKADDAVPREAFRWSWLTATVLTNMGNVLTLADPTMGVMVSGVSGVASVVASIAMLVYLRLLAKRIPNDDLVAKTGLLLVLYVLCMCAMSVGMLMIASALSGAHPSGLSQSQAESLRTGFIVSCSAGVIGGVLVIGWRLLLNTYRKRLSEAYIQAVRTKTVRL